VYLGVLFVSFHYFFFVYINSSFLSQFLNDSWIGYVYIAGSLTNIFVLLNAHRILRRFGNFKLITTFIILEIIALLTLAHATYAPIAIIAFIAQHAINPVIIYCLDVILDTYSNQNEQGKNRGIFLTILNTPPIIATIITGYILTGHNFGDIYTLSALFLLPLLFLSVTQFKNFVDPKYKRVEVGKVMERLSTHRAVRNILIDNIVLQMFYAIMTIYLPLYLQREIGLSLSEIALMFSIMLIPFVLLQFPIGKVADEKIGEKELLIGGFILMGIAMSTIGWMDTHSVVIWTIILVATRIGAAIVEIATETYFFKHIHPTDADMIGVFRMSHAIAFALTPLVGAVVLRYVDIQNMFIIGASIILIVGLRYAFDLRDTR
jgi:MFS family permease